MSKRKEDQPETNDGEAEEVADNAQPPAKKSRGRPRVHAPVQKDPNAPKRGRGRPPAPKKEDSGDAPAKAKKQSKVAKKTGSTPGKRGRGRPKGSTKSKGRGRPKKVENDSEPEEEEEEEAAEEEST